MRVIKLISILILGILATCSAAYSQGSGGGGGGVGGGSVGGGGSSPSSSGSGPIGSAPAAGGARSPNARGDGSFGDFGSFQTTGTMKGRITGISVAEHRVTVENDKGKVKTFKLASDAKMKADKKSDLGQKKDLVFEDFQTGQLVKVVFRDSDEAAMEVKLLAK